MIKIGTIALTKLQTLFKFYQFSANVFFLFQDLTYTAFSCHVSLSSPQSLTFLLFFLVFHDLDAFKEYWSGMSLSLGFLVSPLKRPRASWRSGRSQSWDRANTRSVWNISQCSKKKVKKKVSD